MQCDLELRQNAHIDVVPIQRKRGFPLTRVTLVTKSWPN